MVQPCCAVCGGHLRPSDIKHGKKKCISCIHKKRVASLLSEEYRNNAFSRLWGKELFKRLSMFLVEHEIPLETQVRMLPKAAVIFQEAEKSFRRPEDMSEEWLEEMIDKGTKDLFPSFFRAFLVKEQIIAGTDKDEKKLEAIQAKLDLIPQNYRRVMEVFFHERIALRKKQIKQNARRPLAVSTIVGDFEVLSRLVRWLTENLPQLRGWDMVQEEYIHQFLLTLTPKHREVVRKDLYLFFRLARKRRMITHVPVMNHPAKELPRTVEPLRVEEQKTIARLIRESSYTHSEEALLTAFCLYHGLSSAQIRSIKTDETCSSDA